MNIVFYTPRNIFDPAIIEIIDSRVHYSRSRLMKILIDQYVSNLEPLQQYRQAPRDYLENIARRSAIKWLSYIRYSSHYGNIERRPVIVDDE